MTNRLGKGTGEGLNGGNFYPGINGVVAISIAGEGVVSFGTCAPDLYWHLQQATIGYKHICTAVLAYSTRCG